MTDRPLADRLADIRRLCAPPSAKGRPHNAYQEGSFWSGPKPCFKPPAKPHGLKWGKPGRKAK